jgi:Flp pilus assembly protein TadG
MMRGADTLCSFRRSERGAVAAEFALILAALIVLILGTINAALMIYSTATLHYAAESAARCATVSPSVCTSGYISTFPYAGVAMATRPTFVLSSQPCGNQVIATATYAFSTGLVTVPVTITAKACRPLG